MGSQNSRQNKNFGPELFTHNHEVRIKKVFKIQDDPEPREPTPVPEFRPIRIGPPVYIPPQPAHRVIMVQNRHAQNKMMSPIYSPPHSQPFYPQKVPIYQNSLRTINTGQFYN